MTSAYDRLLYEAKPLVSRVIFPKVLLLFFLFLILGLAVRLNAQLLQWSIPMGVWFAVAALLALLFFIESMLGIMAAQRISYCFYDSRLDMIDAKRKGGRLESLSYASLANISIRRNVLDTLFGTGTICIGVHYRLTALKHFNFCYALMLKYREHMVKHYIQDIQPEREVRAERESVSGAGSSGSSPTQGSVAGQ